MESKRLHLAEHTQRIILTASQSGDIEVPAGEYHYHLELGETKNQTYTFHLRHSDCRIRVTGLVKSDNTAPILETKVIHHAPHTQAETLIRTLVTNGGQPRYTGVIRIEEGAQNSESFLNHHSLLLGEEGQSWTTPSLEILANEVKCSHAATIRTVTDTDLFYARSRGISKLEAEKLLIDAFIHDVQS